MEELKTTLKSILMTSATQLQAYQLNEDYKALVGKNIPYEQYGYKSLVDFLKSITDVLSINGSNLFSPVSPNVKGKKRKKKRKKRKNQATLRTPENEAYAVNYASTSQHSWRTAKNSFKEDYTNPPAINLKMHFDYAKQTMQLATNVKISGIKIGEEHKNPYKTNMVERKPLRYPKTLINIDRNDAKFGVSQRIPGASRISMVRQRISVLKQGFGLPRLESPDAVACRSHSRKRPDPPSMKTSRFKNLPSIPEFQATSQDQIPKTKPPPTFILDLPIPSTIPDVPEAFVKTKSDDLIDFESEVKWPQSPQVPSGRVGASKSTPFMEVIKLIENLKISD